MSTTVVLLLRHLERHDVADRVMAAIKSTLADGIKTRDLGGEASTTEYTEALAAHIEMDARDA